MRKITVFVLCLFLLAGSVAQAFATDSGSMNLSLSAAELYRGDTLTVTVRVSQVNGCTAAGYVARYDQGVFEWVSGSILVSGSTMGDFSNGTAAVAFGEGKDLGGELFRFTLRVKDTAAFGKTSLNGQASIKVDENSIPASCGSAQVTILCRHAYEKPVKTDDTNHTSTCIYCSTPKTEAHNWKDLQIHSPATCKDPGSKTVECTDCGHTLVVPIPVNEAHSYGSWTRDNQSTHSRVCNVCGKKATAGHTWKLDTVLEEATCTKTGLQKLKCTGCGATKEETIPLADHSYSQFQRVDGTSHTHSCTLCGHTEVLEHSFGELWEHTQDNHYRSCTDCGEKTEVSVHIPGPAATETEPQLCTVCGRMLMPALNHDHTFAEAWETDETAHWHCCASCIITSGWEAHSYTDDCDPDCNVCGRERQAPHSPQTTLSADESGHYYLCAQCGEKLELTAHTPGEPATVTTAQHCTVCDFMIAPVLPHDPVYDRGTTVHYHLCACGERVEEDPEDCPICKEMGIGRELPWPWICLAEGVILGGVILWLLLRGKKDRRYRDYY